MSFNKSLGGILVISNGLGGHFAHFQFCKGILVIIKIRSEEHTSELQSPA